MDSNEDDVKSYLETRHPGHIFTCELLQGQPGQRNRSFKVSASASLQDTLYDSSAWPAGVIVRRFNFGRNKQTGALLPQPQQEQ